MSRSRRLAGAIGAGLLLTAAPSIATAHAIGGTFQLPVPLWLYLAGAAVAVGASFVVTSLMAREPGTGRYALRPIPSGLATLVRWLLRVIGLAWWYGAIVVGFVVGDISQLPAVLLWTLIWAGLPIVAALVGNPWPSLSPFRTTFAGMSWLASRLDARTIDLGVPYPAAAGRWPAVVLLAAGVLTELHVLVPESATATSVAVIMTLYTLLTLAGMLVFGQIAWLRNAELFEVELAWFGRIGPIGRRSVSAELCEGCGEACDPERCIDCPECSTAGDDSEREPGLRPWLVGITDVARAGWSDAAFIILALAGVTYDGMRETAFGAAALSWLLPPMTSLFGVTLLAFTLVDVIAFVILVGVFIGAFVLIRSLIHAIGGAVGPPGAYAATLLPIASGYLIAHYLTLVIQGVVWLPELIVDPLVSVAPDLSAIPVSAVWYLSVAAIVGGHIAGIVLAHRLALLDTPRRATLAGLPMVGLMIAYTILSLWIIAQPIVIEPGVTPAAFR